MELYIKNFALIDDVKIKFQKGLNVLTGETGAGKSMLVNALSAVLGRTGRSDWIRSGEDASIIEALFDISDNNFIKNELQDNENILVISREIIRDRGNVYRIQGRLTTLSNLKEITQELIDIHSQFENQSLLEIKNHLVLLDRFGKEKIQKLKDEVKNLFDKFTDLRQKIDELKKQDKENFRNYEINKYQIEEIEKSNLVIGEDIKLESELLILQNLEKIKRAIDWSYNLLYLKDNSAIEYIQDSLEKIKEVQIIDAGLSQIVENIQNSLVYLEEGISLLQKYINRFDFSEDKLQQLSERVDLINRLKRKYGETIEEILIYKDKIKQQVESFENKEEKIKEMEGDLKEIEKELIIKCEKLSQRRKEVAEELKSKIETELHDLAMEGALFDISIKQEEDERGINYKNKCISIKNTGWDKVEFLISTNVGEKLKPLNKIASGGELSRVMLAIKSSLQDADEIPVLIFDEVDAGIGGEAGIKIGEKLVKLSKNHQVICITHLPTIACFADNHFQVVKSASGGKTKVEIKTLASEEEKIEEISRMLRGKRTGEITRSDARDLLKMARKSKKGIDKDAKT